MQRHKQETGSPSRAPFSRAFPYYKALPPPASAAVAGFSASFSKRRAEGWDIQPDPVTQPKATSVPAQGSGPLRQAGGRALDIGSQSWCTRQPDPTVLTRTELTSGFAHIHTAHGRVFERPE